MRVGEYFDGPQSRPKLPICEHPASIPTTDPRADEIAALKTLGFSKPLIRRATRQAEVNGTHIEAELLANGAVRADAYFAAMARFLRLPFIEKIDPASVVDVNHLDTRLLRPNQLRLTHVKKEPQVAIVPEAAKLADLAALLDRIPDARRGLVVTTPDQILSAIWSAGAARRTKDATGSLFETLPHASSRIVLSGAQGFFAGCCLVALLAALIVVPLPTLLVLHIVLSSLYFCSLILRTTALAYGKQQKTHRAPTTNTDLTPLPTYTVMVALYREAAVANQLVRSLERLDWPASLLDIKLVCEADDIETIATLEVLPLKPHFEIVRVPPSQPRTKPKALTYALCAARGEFLAIYDAEDRPHPKQLREAFQHFRNSPPTVACLQAPLVITNASSSFFSALFALEYAALFRGLLPMLAAYRLPLPLGGTSNHFRTAVLRQVGGWDPFNVTEDADLGVRLYRHGYRAETLQHQTLEDAPTTARVWFGQRTRWYKGWMQTWLVTLRNPHRHIKEMGPGGAFVFHLMIGGMLVSALLHPLLLLLVGWGIYACIHEPSLISWLMENPLLAIDSINIVGSYYCLITLGLRSMTKHERRRVGWRWMVVPFYWMMTSLAAWKAFNELRTRPFFWNKTPHTPVDAASGKTK